MFPTFISFFSWPGYYAIQGAHWGPETVMFVWNVPSNSKGHLWFNLQRGKRPQWICGKCYWQAAILGLAHGCQTHDVELQCLAPNSAVILFVLVSVMQSSHCPAWFSEADVKMLPATPHSVCPALSEHYWPTWPSLSIYVYALYIDKNIAVLLNIYIFCNCLILSETMIATKLLDLCKCIFSTDKIHIRNPVLFFSTL